MKTNLKNHLVEFSQGWESYVNECMRLVDDSLRFYVTKDHRVYEVLIREVVSEIQSLLDNGYDYVNAWGEDEFWDGLKQIFDSYDPLLKTWAS